MAERPQDSGEAVATLFAERQRYEGWLATLDAKRAVTPAHIYSRVHADYTARLQRVNEQLMRHRAALREMEATFIDRITSLDIDEAKYKDEMAEADLRANVGELDARDFREVLERTSLGLEQVTAERLRASTELTNLRAILGDDGEIGVLEIGTSELTVTRTPPAVPASPEPPARRESKAAAARAPEEERDAWGLAPEDPMSVVSQPPAPPSAAPAGAPAASSAFDDLEFLRSMVESRNTGEHAAIGNGAAPTPPTPSPAAPAPKRETKEAPPAGSPAKGAAARAPAEPPPAPRKAEPAAAPVAASATNTASPSPAAPAPAAAKSSSGKLVSPTVSQELEPIVRPRATQDTAPSYLRDMPPEQVKTLKCQECGTLNYPTEWYCERCGAELAAL